MIERTCKTCAFQKAEQVGWYHDEEDGEIPLFRRHCEKLDKDLTVLDFACGLWKERTI